MTKFNVGDLLLFNAFGRLAYIQDIRVSYSGKRGTIQTLSVFFLTDNLIYSTEKNRCGEYLAHNLSGSIISGYIEHYKINREKSV